MNKLILKRDNIIGMILVAMGFIGFLNTVMGEFSGGEGVGAHFFPQITFIIMGISGGIMIFEKSDEVKKEFLPVTPLPVSIFLLTGVLYFFMLRRFGLTGATLIYLIGMFMLLTPKPLKNFKSVLIPTAIILVIIHVLFNYIVELVY